MFCVSSSLFLKGTTHTPTVSSTLLKLIFCKLNKYEIDEDNTCHPISPYNCYPCTASNYYNFTESSQTFYYKLNSYEYGTPNVQQFMDSNCEDFYSYAPMYYESCSKNLGSQYNCAVFRELTELKTLKLSLSSTEDISLSFVKDDEEVFVQVSKTKVYAQGNTLGGLHIHSGGSTFFVERQLSSSEYASSLGVFTLGKTYNQNPFTFTVDSELIDLPVAVNITQSVTLAPFFVLEITNSDTYDIYCESAGELEVFTDRDYSLNGMALHNPLFSFVNMTFYPAYSSMYENGNLIFQLEKTSSPFYAMGCPQYNNQIEGDNYTNYYCQLVSLSDFLENFSSLLSFSLDEFGERVVTHPDEMAFDLF